MSSSRRVIMSAAVAAAALSVTACGAGDSEPMATTVTETTTAESATPMTDDGASSSDEDEDAEEGAGAGDDGGVLEVTVRGEQGVLALQHSGSVPAGVSGPSSGKLITGPGGCFAFVGAGAPQLAVFPPAATFVLQNGKPSVTVDGVEHAVGREFAAETTELSVAATTGVPERCARGSADTVLVID